MTSFLKSFWGSLVMLIALLVVLEKAGGVSQILKGTTGFVTGTVNAFKT
jgi:hypothetical protein